MIVDPEAPARKRAGRFQRSPPLLEGATQKQSGKWKSQTFPGREFDDPDEYRAAKSSIRAARRVFGSVKPLGGRQ